MKTNKSRNGIKLWALRGLVAIMGATFLFACNDDKVGTNQENAVFKLSAVYDNNAAQRTANDIVITSFILNIEEIELEVDDEAGVEGPFVSDVEMQGPFVVDL